MLDGKADRLPDALEHELTSDAVTPRLPNAAAWLQELSALELEFERAQLLQPRGGIGQARGHGVACELMLQGIRKSVCFPVQHCAAPLYASRGAFIAWRWLRTG